jgi:hypothetical protein
VKWTQLTGQLERGIVSSDPSLPVEAYATSMGEALLEFSSLLVWMNGCDRTRNNATYNAIAFQKKTVRDPMPQRLRWSRPPTLSKGWDDRRSPSEIRDLH